MAQVIGRLDAQQAVQARLKLAREGRRGVIVVTGGTGMGKSRLLAEERQYAELLGMNVLAGRADEQRLGRPLAALREALSGALLAEHSPAMRSLVRAVDQQIRHRTLPGGRSTEVMSGGTAHAVTRLLATWSVTAPVLLIVDDLQAVDPDTCDVLSHLVRQLRHEPVVVFASARLPVPPHVRALLSQWERTLGPDLTKVDLHPLDVHDTTALARALHGAPLDQVILTELVALSQGNPLLLEEAVAAYHASRPLDVDASSIDAGTSALLLARLMRLHPHCVAVGEVLALLERPRAALLPVVAGCTGLPQADVDGAVEALLSSDTLTSNDRGYRFTLPVVPRILLERIGDVRTWQLHQALATALAEERAAGRSVDLLELAPHVAATAQPGDEQAVELLLAVARELADQTPRSAADWFARALDLLPAHDPRRWTALAARTRVLYLSARLDDAVADGQQVLGRSADPGALARTGTLVVAALLSLGRVDLAVATAQRLLSTGGPQLLRVRTQLAAGLNYLDRFDEAQTIVATVLAEHPDPATSVLAHGVRASLALGAGSGRDMLDALDAAYAVPGLTPWGRLSAVTNDAVHSALGCEMTRSRTALTEARALADSLGATAFEADLELAKVLLAWRGGDWRGLDERLARGAADLDARGQRLNLAMLAALRLELLTARGELGAAEELDRRLDVDRAVGASFVAWARAGLRMTCGDFGAAGAILEQAWLRDRSTGRVSSAALLLTRLTDLEVASGRPDAARAHAATLTALVEEIGLPRLSSFALRAEGTATRDPHLLREAAQRADDDGMPVEAAHARFAAGLLTADADHDLLPALHCYEAVEAESWRRQVTKAMRQRGLPVPRRSRIASSRPSGLSEAEHRLASLVQDGLSNRQIASALSLSHKTIEVYLSRLFDKAGVRTRVELAVALSEGRLTRAE